MVDPFDTYLHSGHRKTLSVTKILLFRMLRTRAKAQYLYQSTNRNANL